MSLADLHPGWMLCIKNRLNDHTGYCSEDEIFQAFFHEFFDNEKQKLSIFKTLDYCKCSIVKCHCITLRLTVKVPTNVPCQWSPSGSGQSWGPLGWGWNQCMSHHPDRIWTVEKKVQNPFSDESKFALNLETEVSESGGRVGRLRIHVAGSPVGVQSIHCTFISPKFYAHKLCRDSNFKFQQDLAPAHVAKGEPGRDSLGGQEEEETPATWHFCLKYLFF